MHPEIWRVIHPYVHIAIAVGLLGMIGVSVTVLARNVSVFVFRRDLPRRGHRLGVRVRIRLPAMMLSSLREPLH
jgi:hypothetical protein